MEPSSGSMEKMLLIFPAGKEIMCYRYKLQNVINAFVHLSFTFHYFSTTFFDFFLLLLSYDSCVSVLFAHMRVHKIQII